MTLTVTASAATCPSNGQVAVCVNNGVPLYNYTITNGSNITISIPASTACFTFSGLPAGSYSLTVTDGNNSVLSQAVLVPNNYNTLSFVPSTISGCCIIVNAVGGQAPYQYSIAPQTLPPTPYSAPQASNVFCSLPSGTYNIRIYDACNNFITTSSIIGSNSLLLNTPTCTANGASQYNVTVAPPSNGTAPFQYSWIHGTDTLINTTGVFTGLTGCEYNIRVTDNCLSVGILQNVSSCIAPPTISVQSVNCTGGTLDVQGSGGTPPYSFNVAGNINTTGSFTGLATGVNGYLVNITDSCGTTNSLYAACTNGDSITYNCTPQCGFLSDITICTNASLPGAYPIQYTCLTCTPNITLSQNVANTCVTFPGLTAGLHDFQVQDAFGTTLITTPTCEVDTLSISGIFSYACPGSVLFSVHNNDIFYPIIANCLTCTGATSTVVNAFPFTYTNVDSGWQVFQFTDNCGFVLTDSIYCPIDTLDATISYQPGCPGTATFILQDSLPQFPVTYTCQTCVPVVSTTTSTDTTILQGVFVGTHLFTMVDACGNAKTLTFDCTIPPLIPSVSWQAGCPGNLTFSTPSNYPIQPLTYHCQQCGQADTTSSDSIFIFPNIYAGTDTFTVSDSCGNIFTYYFSDSLPPLTYTLSHTVSCPIALTLTPDSTAFYPITFSCNTCPTPTNTVLSGNASLTGLCPGNYDIVILDACARTDSVSYNLPASPILISTLYKPGCPGTITLTPNDTSYCYPLQYNCPTCPINSLQVISNTNPIVWDGIMVDSTYSFTVTDACGNQISDTIIAIPADLLTATLTSNNTCPNTITISPTSSSISYPLTGICAACPQDTIVVISGDILFTNLCTGAYSINLLDNCGQSLTLNTVIAPHTPADSAVWNAGCPGSVTFYSSDTSVCFPITYHCTTCTAATDTTSMANTLTFPNVSQGVNTFTLTDACGNLFTQTINCFNPNPAFSLSHSATCPYDLNLIPDSAAQNLPYTYECLSCGLATITSDSIAAFSGLCTGTYTIVATDVCLQTDTLVEVIPVTPVSLQSTWTANCPGSLAFAVSGTSICYPLTLHCGNCGVSDTTVMDPAFSLSGISPGLHTFTLTDNCGNTFTSTSLDMLPPLNVNVNCSGGCPESVSIEIVSSVISLPIQIVCTDCVPPITFTAIDTISQIPSVGSGTHLFEVTDACGRQVTVSNYCEPDTIKVTATALGCDSMTITTDPPFTLPLPAGYFYANPLANGSIVINSDSSLLLGLNQGQYVVNVANPQGCVSVPDTAATNYALFTLYQVLANGSLVPIDSNYSGTFVNIPPGLTTVVPTFCDTTGGFPIVGSGGGGSGSGGGGGGGTGGGGGNGDWQNPFFLSTISADCRQIIVKAYPTDTVQFTLKDSAGLTIGSYLTVVNDTIAYFNNLTPNTLYNIDFTYNGYQQHLSIRTDSMDNVLLAPGVLTSCDSIKIIVPDTTSGFVYYLQDTLTQAIIMTSTNGLFAPVPPGDYYILGTKVNCDTSRVFVHIDKFDPILYSIGACDSIFAWVPNRTGITFTLYNAIDTFSNTSGIFSPIPAGTYTLHADHSYCGNRDTTLTIGNTLTMLSSLVTCDSLRVTATGGSNLSYHITRIDTTGSPYTSTNLSGAFGNVPAGNYAIVVSNGYCEPARDTLLMGTLPTVIATKIACDSVVASLSTPLSNVTYSIYNGTYSASSTSGHFGSVPLGTYTVKATHPQCNSDSTTVTMGGINAMTLVQPLCDSVSASIPFFTSIIYTLTDTFTHALIGINSTGNFGSLSPSTYKIKAKHPNCGADSAYFTTGTAPIMTIATIACDSIHANVPGYTLPFTYTLSGTANNGTLLNIVNTSGKFGDIYAGTYTVSTVHPNCGTISKNVTVGGIPTPIVAQPKCDSIRVSVPGYTSGLSYLLHHVGGVYPDSTNTTGIFRHIHQGTYLVTATHPYCGSSSTSITTGGLPVPVVTKPRCDSIRITLAGVSPYLTFTLQNSLGTPIATNTTGYFGQVVAGSYVVLITHAYCGTRAVNVNMNNLLPQLTATIIACDSITAKINGYSNITYQIQGATNGVSITNTTGNFGGLTPNVYTVTGTHPNCGTVSKIRTLNKIPPMLTNQTACDAVTASVPGYATGITYTLHDVNNIYPDVTNTTGIFTGVDSGYYRIIGKHLHCGSDTNFVNMGGIPMPTILQKTCDSIIVKVAGFTSNITYTVTNGIYTASNTNGHFGSLPVGSYIITATHLHCGRNTATISLSDAPINPQYCVKPQQKDSLGICKFAWRLTFNAGQHKFSVFRSGQNGQLMTPTSGQLIYDLFPDVYFIYDSLQCNGILDTFPNPNIQIAATPAYCPNQGCLIASGGKTNAQWQAWAASTNLPICGAVGDDVYVIQNAPSGINPVSTTGVFCGLAPGQTYKIYLYSQFSYSQGACRTDSIYVTLPTSINPLISSPPAVLCSGSNVTNLSVSVSGMYPPCTFELLNPPAGYALQTTILDTMSLNCVFANLPSGTYVIRVSACGLSAVSTGVVFAAPPLIPTYEYLCDSSLHLKSPCLGGATYSWSNSSGTFTSSQCNPILPDLAGDTYSLTISTPYCTLLSNAQLVVPPFASASATVPTPTFTPTNVNLATSPINFILLGSNFVPANYWSINAFTQVPPIDGTLSNINIVAPSNYVSMDADSLGDYYYQIMLESNFGTCLLVANSFNLALPLPLVELDLQAEAIEKDGKMATKLIWTAQGTSQNGRFQIFRKTPVNPIPEQIGELAYQPTQKHYALIDNNIAIIECGEEWEYEVRWKDENSNLVASQAKKLLLFPQTYQIYPNPVTDWLQVETACAPTSESLEFHLFDAAGRTIPLPAHKTQNRRTAIYVKDLPQGTYFLQIVSENGKSVKQKFVKKE